MVKCCSYLAEVLTEPDKISTRKGLIHFLIECVLFSTHDFSISFYYFADYTTCRWVCPDIMVNIVRIKIQDIGFFFLRIMFIAIQCTLNMDFGVWCTQFGFTISLTQTKMVRNKRPKSAWMAQPEVISSPYEYYESLWSVMRYFSACPGRCFFIYIHVSSSYMHKGLFLTVCVFYHLHLFKLIHVGCTTVRINRWTRNISSIYFIGSFEK